VHPNGAEEDHVCGDPEPNRRGQGRQAVQPAFCTFKSESTLEKCKHFIILKELYYAPPFSDFAPGLATPP
jgi:hypothetical protein